MTFKYSLSALGFLFCCSLLLSSCGSRKNHTLFNSTMDIASADLKTIYVVNDQGADELYYKIRINDLISVRNLQNKEWGSVRNTTSAVTATVSDEKNNTYLVDTDGFANLPAIGKVRLAGLTRREATLKLQDLYGSSDYLKDPIIELKVVNLKVTMLGEFSTQGNFLLEKESTTLIDVIGLAGGFTKTADPKTLKIIRGNRNNPEIIYVNLSDINSLSSNKLIMQNNDIVYIARNKDADLAEQLQRSNSILQPILVIVNLAILIFTLTK